MRRIPQVVKWPVIGRRFFDRMQRHIRGHISVPPQRSNIRREVRSGRNSHSQADFAIENRRVARGVQINKVCVAVVSLRGTRNLPFATAQLC